MQIHLFFHKPHLKVLSNIWNISVRVWPLVNKIQHMNYIQKIIKR